MISRQEAVLSFVKFNKFFKQLNYDIGTDTLIDGNLQKITAGMTLNAEIEIGKRRIIEFFVYPII